MSDNTQLTTTTNDILDEQVREKRRAKTAEIPVELKEFATNYDVEGLIGEGGMSAVYRAKHRALNKPMAIKMLHAHLLRDAVQLKRFEQEAQALFMLQHENIVTVREFGSTTTGKPYLVMDFLEGKSLSEIIKKDGPIPVHRALKLFVQVCDALEHAHSKAIIHRDIKPSNIVITEDEKGEDSVRIVDFGIAKFACDDINPGLTQTGDVFGSPLYMSPEQCLGHKLDQRTDMYALGCVMYEALSGHPPLVGETALATIHKHTTEMPQPLKVPNCDRKLRERLDEIVFKTLEKDPEKRYQSMAQLKKELQELKADTGYRGKTGYYVRYARANRRILNSIKSRPVQFITGFALLIAFTAATALMVLEHGQGVTAAPVPINAQIDWNWMAKPVDPAPVNFVDKIRQAWVLIDDAIARLGHKDEKVKKMERRVAVELLKYGYWDKAIGYLMELRNGYEDSDPMVADLSQLIGDVYVQKKQWADALVCYRDAIERYTRSFDTETGDNSEKISRLKYAWCLLRHNEVAKAKTHFETVLAAKNLAPTRFEYAFGTAGIADCDLAQVQGGVKDEVKRGALLKDAELNYLRAGPRLGDFSKHDSLVCKLRLADIYIMEGKWKDANALYSEVMNNLSLLNNSETANVERNYARLLLRNFNIARALEMDRDAKEAERRATKEQNEQNTVRFDAEDRY